MYLFPRRHTDVSLKYSKRNLFLNGSVYKHCPNLFINLGCKQNNAIILSHLLLKRQHLRILRTQRTVSVVHCVFTDAFPNFNTFRLNGNSNLSDKIKCGYTSSD